MFFPEGTAVGCLPAALHVNTAVFGEDATQFLPERWLVEESNTLQR